MNFLQITLDNLGFTAVGRECGVSAQAVRQWWILGKLPDTEWLDISHPRRTNYASDISNMAGCERNKLLIVSGK